MRKRKFIQPMDDFLILNLSSVPSFFTPAWIFFFFHKFVFLETFYCPVMLVPMTKSSSCLQEFFSRCCYRIITVVFIKTNVSHQFPVHLRAQLLESCVQSKSIIFWLLQKHFKRLKVGHLRLSRQRCDRGESFPASLGPMVLVFVEVAWRSLFLL